MLLVPSQKLSRLSLIANGHGCNLCVYLYWESDDQLYLRLLESQSSIAYPLLNVEYSFKIR